MSAWSRRFTHFGCFDEGLGHLAVASSVTGGDEVGHSAALQERSRSDLFFAEEFGKRDHFHQPQPDYGCFGVVAKTEAVAEPGADCHDILATIK